MRTFTLFLLTSNLLLLARSFNIDTGTAKVFSRRSGDYFGYAVTFHKSGNKFWALVGAPLGTDRYPLEGTVYRCEVNGNNPCGRIQLSTAGTPYENTTSQWMGASLLSFGVNQDIVACAPRFKDVPSRSRLWLHGRCAIVNGNDFTFKRYWNPAKKEVKSDSYNSYGYPLQGFSIAKSNSTKAHLITGMPGARRSLGALGYDRLLKINGASTVPFTISGSDRLDQADYMGYSVAWGQFSQRLYGDMVGGAPKGSFGKGKVLIYEMGGNLNIRSVIENTDAASYTGSYFGAALCTSDLNNDGKPDLIIGAPLFTTKEEDEGKVYIYLSDAQGAVNEVSQIEGDTRGGRFGTTIAAVGDLNRDGYPDIAIGAPYGGPDGKGSVYIYHGSVNGLETQAVQKIFASDFPEKPSGFGQSISGEMDIDRNGYPDIVIGSYVSSHVYVLKSRPILIMTGEITLNRTKVSLSGTNVKPCRVINSVDYECIEVQFCLDYTGFGVPSSIDMQVDIETDKGKIGQKRAIMIEGGKEKSLISFQKTYTKDKKNCTAHTIYVQQNPSSLSSGITVSANYKYIQPTSGCNGVCPVADYARKGLTSQVHEKEITYLRGCRSETKCISDLKVKGAAVIPGGLSKIEYGVVDKFALKLNVENGGENAFLSKMTVQYEDDFEPIGVKFINDQPPLWEKEKINGKNILKFPLASPFVPNRTLEIDVSFSVAKQRPSAKRLSFEIEAKSDGSDDKNTANNKAKIELAAGLIADLTVSGTASPYEIRYDKKPIAKEIKNETEVGAVVNYEFLVQNLGPAPVQGISARISLLTKYQQKYVAMLFSAQVRNSYCNVTGKVNPDNLQTLDTSKSRRRRAVPSSGVTELDCRSGQCITFDCYIGLLRRGEGREINLRTRIYQNTFIEGKLELTKLTSTINININPAEKEFLSQPDGEKPDSAKVSVFVGPQLEDKKGDTTSVAWWIILLAVLGAILLIVATVVILYKVGFFERKRGKEISGPNVDD